MQSLVRLQLLFTLGMLACGGLEALVAFQWVGVRGIEGVAYSILLCLIPGWLTIYASALTRNKDMAVYAVLAGTGLRMTFVLIGLLIVGAIRPELGFREFTVWLIPSYMVSLVMETSMLLTPALVKVSTRTDA
jgi:hypothetical protein